MSAGRCLRQYHFSQAKMFFKRRPNLCRSLQLLSRIILAQQHTTRASPGSPLMTLLLHSPLTSNYTAGSVRVGELQPVGDLFVFIAGDILGSGHVADLWVEACRPDTRALSREPPPSPLRTYHDSTGGLSRCAVRKNKRCAFDLCWGGYRRERVYRLRCVRLP